MAAHRRSLGHAVNRNSQRRQRGKEVALKVKLGRLEEGEKLAANDKGGRDNITVVMAGFL